MKMRLVIGACVVLALLALAGGAWAMDSPNYRLDWYVPMTSGGGGPSASSGYHINFTLGQSAVGLSASPAYQAGLGYWVATGQHKMYLPLVLKQ